MAATATIGLNSNLLIGTTTTSSEATSIGNVMGATLSLDADEVDVTPITSTGHRAFIPGPRSCTIAFELAYDHSDVQHLLLATNWSSGATNYYHVELPGDLGGAAESQSTNNWTVRGFVTNLGPGIDPSDKHGASVSVRCIEAPTLL